ncbi:MAG: Ni,Fe-hydrogenase small subunit, partial [Desulfitobacterium hafniense]
GCSESGFYGQFSPLYAKQENFSLPGLGQIHADTVGKVVGGATVVGLGAHLIATVASGRLKNNDSEQKKED